MDKKSALSVYAYNNNLEREVWVEQHNMDSELEREIDTAEISEELLLYGPGIQELLENTVEHVKKETQFPYNLDFSQNTYCRNVIENMAEAILDEYVSDEMYKAIQKVILTRAAKAVY